MNIRSKMNLVMSSLFLLSLQGCGFGSFPVADNYYYSTYSEPYSYDYAVPASPSPYPQASYYYCPEPAPSPEPSASVSPVLIVRPKKTMEYYERIGDESYHEEVMTEEQVVVEKKSPTLKKDKRVKVKQPISIVEEEVDEKKEYLLCAKETIIGANGKPLSQVVCQPIEEDTDEI